MGKPKGQKVGFGQLSISAPELVKFKGTVLGVCVCVKIGEALHGNPFGLPVQPQKKLGLLSREVRIRVPFFLWSILVGEPLPQKRGEKGTTGGPSCESIEAQRGPVGSHEPSKAGPTSSRNFPLTPPEPSPKAETSLGCCRSPSKKLNFLLVRRKDEGNPKS